MRLLFAFSFVLFFTTTSLGQSFTLPELIKMSKMNVDDFDTYVTSKGFVFEGADNEDQTEGVSYALNLNISNSKASKFIGLYERHYDDKYYIHFQTIDKNEYINIKNQIKTLGFKLKNSRIFTTDEGKVVNRFLYIKGKSEITIYVDGKSFEVNYKVKY